MQKIGNSLRDSLQKPPFKKQYKISAKLKLSTLATTPVCKFLNYVQIYSKSPLMLLNHLQGGLVYKIPKK